MANNDELAEALGGVIDAIKRDAARYRWLIDNSFDREGVPQLHIWLHAWEPHSQTGEPTEWKQRVRGPAVDRAIDAAMLKTPNAGGNSPPRGEN